MQTSSGVIGVCLKPTPQLINHHNLLIIDHLQDPGNLGTLMRSAMAFDFLTIVASVDSVSFYNPKVLRATQGLIFELNLMTAALEQFLPQLKTQHYQIIGSFLHPQQPLPSVTDCHSPLKALLIGNEGQGLNLRWQKLIDYNFLIPMRPGVESLNVAVAGSIMMSKLYKP